MVSVRSPWRNNPFGGSNILGLRRTRYRCFFKLVIVATIAATIDCSCVGYLFVDLFFAVWEYVESVLFNIIKTFHYEVVEICL